MTATREAPPKAAPTEHRPPMVIVERVTKWFGDVVAVSDVSFSVGPGVTALLGPNGAGKSTVLRLMCGLTKPSQGEIRLFGTAPRHDLTLFGRIGLVPQQEAVFEALPALGFVRLAGLLHGVPDADAVARRSLAEVELDADDRRPLRTYSKGMRQRVKVAQAIVHNPYVIILDEPLTGLDPRQRRHMTDLFHAIGDQGRCVVVSSHVLEEVERFGSRVLVIAKGRLAAEGDYRAIRSLMDDRPHRLRIRTNRPGQVASALMAAGTVVGIELVDAETVIVDTTQVQVFRRAVTIVARDLGAHLYEVMPLDDDLDSVFRYLVSR